MRQRKWERNWIRTKPWLAVVPLVLSLATACGAPPGGANTAATSEPAVAHTASAVTSATAAPAATARLEATSTAPPTPANTATSRATEAQPAPSSTAAEPSAATAPPATRTATPTASSTSAPTATATSTPTASPSPTPTATLAPLAATEPAQDFGELVADGLEVYRAQYCGVCHELGAAGSGGTFGPAHDGMSATAAARIQEPGYRGGATTAAEYLLESIVNPKAFVVPGYEITSHPMPAYGFLSEQEIMALVQMLLAQQ